MNMSSNIALELNLKDIRLKTEAAFRKTTERVENFPEFWFSKFPYLVFLKKIKTGERTEIGWVLRVNTDTPYHNVVKYFRFLHENNTWRPIHSGDRQHRSRLEGSLGAFARQVSPVLRLDRLEASEAKRGVLSVPTVYGILGELGSHAGPDRLGLHHPCWESGFPAMKPIAPADIEKLTIESGKCFNFPRRAVRACAMPEFEYLFNSGLKDAENYGMSFQQVYSIAVGLGVGWELSVNMDRPRVSCLLLSTYLDRIEGGQKWVPFAPALEQYRRGLRNIVSEFIPKAEHFLEMKFPKVSEERWDKDWFTSEAAVSDEIPPLSVAPPRIRPRAKPDLQEGMAANGNGKQELKHVGNSLKRERSVRD